MNGGEKGLYLQIILRLPAIFGFLVHGYCCSRGAMKHSYGAGSGMYISRMQSTQKSFEYKMAQIYSLHNLGGAGCGLDVRYIIRSTFQGIWNV